MNQFENGAKQFLFHNGMNQLDLCQFPVQETEGGTSFVSEVNSTPIPSAPSLPLESSSLEPDEVCSSHLSLPFTILSNEFNNWDRFRKKGPRAYIIQFPVCAIEM